MRYQFGHIMYGQSQNKRKIVRVELLTKLFKFGFMIILLRVIRKTQKLALLLYKPIAQYMFNEEGKKYMNCSIIIVTTFQVSTKLGTYACYATFIHISNSFSNFGPSPIIHYLSNIHRYKNVSVVYIKKFYKVRGYVCLVIK